MREDQAGARGFSVHVVEPGHLLREGLTMILSAARFDIVSASETLDAAAAIRQTGPTMLVIGAAAEPLTTADQIRHFRALNQPGLVAALIDDRAEETPDCRVFFEAGATICLSKYSTGDILVRALELMALGQYVVPGRLLAGLLPANHATPRGVPARARRSPLKEGLADRPASPPLSAQERRILRCLVDGHSNKAIARRFEIAEATVKVHLKAILRKIRMQNRTQAAIWALNHIRELQPDGEDTSASEPKHDGDGPQIAA